MNKVYTRINWENYPSLVTPINEQNLNKLDFATDSLDNRIINLDTAKVNVTDIQQNIANWTMDEETGIITVTRVNGDTISFDLNIEKIPIDFKLTSEGMLIMTTDDGTQFKADIASMIPVLTFNNSNEIKVTATGTGINKTYTFSIIDNSITDDKLEANYLANIKEETAKAQAASKTATDASAIATNKATIASTSATNAKTSETNAKTSETNAKTSETNASKSATSANASKTSASTSATQAKASENSAKASAIQSESYAHGQTNSRDGENTDNAQYYKEQAKTSETNAKTSETNSAKSESEAKKYAEQVKEISESFSGALRPLGTINFANLPSTADASSGDMYNIADQFTTTADFKEGSGNVIPAGSNVYLTIDRYWDVLAGTPVTGVKGAKEAYYRRGNVNITPTNIGAIAEDGDISETTVTFANTTTRENLVSGEKVSVGFGKIKKWFADLKSFAFKDLVNNLTTTTTGSALDASQGKILNDKYDELNNSLEIKTSTPLSYSSVVNGHTNVSLRKYGKIATFHIGLNIYDTVKSGDLLLTLPNEFRPIDNIYIHLTDINGYNKPMLANINTDGNLYIGIIPSGTSFKGTWFYISETFITI